MITFYLFQYSITAQRNALSITSNCCQNLLPEEFVFVNDALSTLSSRLVHEDKKSSESACLALSRLAESYKNDMNRLRDVAKPEVLENLQKILSANPPTVSSNTFVTVLHILVIMASHGSAVGPMLLKKEIGTTLRQLLVKTRSHGSYTGSTTPIRRGQSLASTSAQAHDLFDRSSSSMMSEQLGATGSSTEMQQCPAAASKSSVAASTKDIIESNKFIELTQRNPQELYEITSLVAELMPPLPADGIFAVDALLVRPGAYIRDPVLWQWQDDKGNWHTYGYNDCRLIEAAHVAGEEEATLSGSGKSFVLNLSSMHEIREDSGTARPIQRKLTSQLQQSSGMSNSGVSDLSKSESNAEKAKKEHDEHLRLTADLTRLLLPVLLEVYSTSAGPGVRHSCIQAFLRMIYHSSTELLLEVVSVSAVSSQIAGMLSSGDLKIIVGALQLSEILLQKMPEEFGVHFRREGVLHQVQKLTDPDNPISVSSYNESPLTSSSAWSTATSLTTATNYSYSSSHPPIPGMQTSSGGGHSGRTWTVAGSSFTNMFPDQLRVSKRREESSSTSPDTSGVTTQASVPLSSIQSLTTASNSSSHSAAPLRLSDMLKRKRVSRRSSGRKGRYSTGSNVPESMPAIPSLGSTNNSTAARDAQYPIPGIDAGSSSMSTSDTTDGTSLRYSVMNESANITAAYDMSLKSSTSDLNPLSGSNSSAAGPSTPSRRSRLADRTSSLLSQLHPARWVRSSPSNPTGGSGMSEATGSSNASQHGHTSAGIDNSGHHNYSGPHFSHGLTRVSSSAGKDTFSNSSSSAAMQSATHAAVALLQKSVSSPATMAHSREKAKRWVREQASRFLESYFKESLGSRHPALTILRRLSAQVDHLAKKPKDGEKSLASKLHRHSNNSNRTSQAADPCHTPPVSL